MPSTRRRLPVLVLAALIAGACGSTSGPTPRPSEPGGPTAVPATPQAAERPFARVAWPAAATACADGAAPLLRQVEATDARTVRFTLCRPDGAFLARLAHPALGVVDAAALDALAADPSAARSVAGAGPYRVEAWIPGQNIRLARVGSEPGAVDAVPTVILRWGASADARLAALQGAEVDGIDRPGTDGQALVDTLPELVGIDREGLTSAYLGFGTGPGLGSTAVRRAFAQGIDQAALADDAFPAGSKAATHLSPCVVPAGCAGTAWYAFNGPAGTAALEAAKFNTGRTLPLLIPDQPVPGLPDPATIAAAVRDQVKESLGVTLEVTPMPAAELSTAVAAGEVKGLYLGGLESALADPSGFLEPLFGPGATGTAASRAKGVADALAEAAAATSAADRMDAFAAANDAIRAAAPIVPLAHTGSGMAFRADVQNTATSPLDVEALGSFMPGDRRQLVVMQEAEPAATWCGAASSPSDVRLCALVTPGLYRFKGASLEPEPALATRCTASQEATVWTCRLPAGLRYTNGDRVDAGDVVASLRAQGDAASPLRKALPASSFGAWDALFGGPLDSAGGG